MAIDYSKWDKIELSDDSDVEVHPNVDKKSFIKWKQQSIHEKRQQRNQDIKNLEMQLLMYNNLNKRVDKLLNGDFPNDAFASKDQITKYLNANFDKLEKCRGENVDPDIGTYNEMVEDLFDQLKRDAISDNRDPQDGTVIKDYLLKHRAKIETVSKEAVTKLDELYKEKNAHISSEDIHTGFDSSFLNKKSVEDDTKIVQNAMETLEMKQKEKEGANAMDKKVLSLSKNIPLQFIDYGDDVTRLAPETEQFGMISANDYKISKLFLLKNMQIISEQQKDALMMKAFEYQLEDSNSKMTYQVIHQSELLAYIREIYDMKKIPFLNIDEMTEIIKMFFDKVIFNPNNQRGKESFLDSVNTKYEHVKNRVKIIEKEQMEEYENGEHDGEVDGVETIQLKSLDDSTELEVNLPDFGSKDPEELAKSVAFNKLPKEMQDAVKTKNLDEVNKVFENIPIKEAEDILELFDEAGVIGVKALLENEDDFNQIKQEYENQYPENNDTKQIEEVEEEINTADIVD